MASAARNLLFRGFDWITQNEFAAAALNTLDNVQGLCSPLTGEDLCLAARLATILDHCEDFTVEIERLTADLNAYVSGRAATRWGAQEAQMLTQSLMAEVRTQILLTDKDSAWLAPATAARFTGIISKLKAVIKDMDA